MPLNSHHGILSITRLGCALVGFLLLGGPALAALELADEPFLLHEPRPVFVASGGQNFDPFHSLSDGQPVGFDVDLLRAVSRVMGLDVDIRLLPWAQARDGLADGSVNIHIGMTLSPERSRTYRFTTPYLIQQYKIFTRSDTRGIEGKADLKNRSVLVQRKGVMSDYLLTHDLANHLMEADGAAEALRLLATGQADCVVMGEFRGLHVIQQLGLKDIQPVGQPVYQTRYGFAVPPASENLVPLLNQGLSLVKKSGEYDRLYDKWFGVLRPRSQTVWNYLRYVAWIIIPLAVALAVSALWSWSLRRKVITRTAQLSQARDAAEAASRAKSQFLATMSHEIRTPLNGVMGMGEFLLSTGLTPQQQDYARTINSSARDLQTILDNILDYSKIDAGERVLVNETYSPTQILTAAVSAIRPNAARKNLNLKTALSRRLPAQVVGDSDALRQVLLNLLDNAVKFTRTGAVQLAADCETEPDGKVRLVVAISDTGIGVPPAARASLFDAFTQADSTSTRRYGGTGLGLAITRHLLDLMDGTLDYEDRPDGGSVFRFTFLAGQVEAPDLGRVSAPWTPALSDDTAWDPADHTILVVEDNPMNQKVVTLMLRKCGFPFEVANNGQEAVDICVDRSFSAILMDCQMPVMDGFEATKAIRVMEQGDRHTPIIALTAGAFKADRTHCLEIGMDDYLTKPTEAKRVAAALRKWIGAPDTLPA